VLGARCWVLGAGCWVLGGFAVRGSRSAELLLSSIIFENIPSQMGSEFSLFSFCIFHLMFDLENAFSNFKDRIQNFILNDGSRRDQILVAPGADRGGTIRKNQPSPGGYLIGDSKLTWGGFGRGDGLFEVVLC